MALPRKLLKIASTNKIFQFSGQSYEQTDGVTMGSPLDPLMLNVFVSLFYYLFWYITKKITNEGIYENPGQV